jgi:uncharacterized protein YecE (DUF72 family)
LEAFLQLLPRSADGSELRHAIEVRHESFRNTAFIELARRYGVAVVLAGDSNYPQIVEVTANFVYLRIMGTSARAANGYSPAAVTGWAQLAPNVA